MEFVRELLLKAVLVSMPWLDYVERVRNPVLDAVFQVASFSGEEDFFAGAIPTAFWLCGSQFGRLFQVLLTATLWGGNGLKNALALPRPKTVRGLQCRDYGFPSTHSMNGVAIPLSLAAYGIARGMVSEAWWGYAVFWAVLVMASRLYLGVHSPADVAGGAVLGYWLYAWSGWYVEEADAFLVASGSVGLWVSVVGPAVLAWAHPRSVRATQSMGESTLVCGMLSGILVGGQGGECLLVPGSGWGGKRWAFYGTLLGLGFAVLLGIRAAVKAMLREMLDRVYGPKWELEYAMVLKYVQYVVVGWMIAVGVPALLVEAGVAQWG